MANSEKLDLQTLTYVIVAVLFVLTTYWAISSWTTTPLISEVISISEGNFYLASLSKDGKETNNLPVFVDPGMIFGEARDFSYPVNFVNNSNFDAPLTQINKNIVK